MKLKLHKKETLWLMLSLGIALLCMLLPGSLVKIQANQEKDVVQQTYSSNYYSGREVSVRMTLYERMKLISGEWDSQWQEVDQSDVLPISDIEDTISKNASTTENGDWEYSGYCYMDYGSVIEAAESGIEVLYEAGIYPESAVSKYSSWYRPTVKLYQYSDSIFDAYTCYVWVVQFDYYDGSMSHVVLIDDTTGLILAGGIQGEGVSISDNWTANMTKQEELPDSVISYYRENQTLNNGMLELSKPDVYFPQYELWNVAFGLSEDEMNRTASAMERKTFLLSAEHELRDYEEAVNEVKNLTDNDKFLYSVQWEENKCWFYILPFTVKVHDNN